MLNKTKKGTVIRMFFELAKKYNYPITPFTPFAPITNRPAWEGLDAQWRKEAIELGEQYLGFSYPYIFASDFMDFSKTGNRVRFESKSFSKRQALSSPRGQTTKRWLGLPLQILKRICLLPSFYPPKIICTTACKTHLPPLR
ncbi:MAG: hypothetical protein GX235_02630 [Clostridiales bacterium]|nr:hypothetical protein [Clostridiales bacterium]